MPADHRVGEPGEGFRLTLATLATFRVSVAGAALGVAQAALGEALRHTTGRTQFGVPLARLGPVPSLLALSWTEIEMARSLTYRAAAAAARDPQANLHLSSMAKVGATEVAGRVVDRAVQVMGRFGLVRGSVIERLYREARPMRIYEGSTEVILDSLARQLVKRHGASQHGEAVNTGQPAGEPGMIIDAHCHVWPDHIAPKVLATRPASLDPVHDGTIAGLRATMDAAGVDRAMVLGVANVARTVERTNEFIGVGRPVGRSRRSVPSTPTCPPRSTSSRCGTTASAG